MGRFLNKSFTDGLGLCPCSLYPPRLGVGTLKGRGLVRVCLSRNGGNSRAQLSSRGGIPLTTHHPEAPPMKVPFFSLCQTSEWGTLLSIVYPHFWLGATPQMVPCTCWVQAPWLGWLLLSLVQDRLSSQQSRIPGALMTQRDAASIMPGSLGSGGAGLTWGSGIG